MSLDEQAQATARAREHRAKAEDLAAWAFRNDQDVKPPDIQTAAGFAAVVHLLLAIEDRLAYGHQSILDGTISCRICRVILLEGNERAHYDWHEHGHGHLEPWRV